MFAALLPIIGNLLSGVLDHFFPNPEDELKKQQLQGALMMALLKSQTTLDNAAAENVRAEITGHSWLQRNWRPITMLVFLGLIVGRFFGLEPTNITPAEYAELWSIVKIGLGGYTVGRSVEKIAPSIAAAMRGNQ